MHSALASQTPQVFWGEIAPCEHVAQFYEHEGVLLETLFGFVSGGLRAGDSAIVIATSQHLNSLHQRLLESGLNLVAARSQDRYIALVADEILDQFMVNHWPDDKLFTDLVDELIARARGNGRRVRAFGEMVALLWARKDHAATVRLEFLWHQICQNQAFSLFCAYPKAGFTRDAAESLSEICKAHSRIV